MNKLTTYFGKMQLLLTLKNDKNPKLTKFFATHELQPKSQSETLKIPYVPSTPPFSY